jgi:aerobic-type carbon monoxide dehydrogenase small subunit (CoxS/CutS family)
VTAERAAQRQEHSDHRERAADDPLIAAMARNDGSQCRFCALGIVLAAKAFLARNLNPDERRSLPAWAGT